ncbi:MAG TPA: ribonuclease P protein component [Bacteroidia bacterium]|nr:ribonuclease P protein component [Bacteroidia bacterium]
MPRLTFNKNERLCSRKAIEELYSNGRSFYCPNLKVIFLPQKEIALHPCQVVFSAPKKSFKRAVDRNLIKRRMREAYRLNKPAFYEQLNNKKIYLHVLFLYNSKEIFSFEEISRNMQQALAELLKKAG